MGYRKGMTLFWAGFAGLVIVVVFKSLLQVKIPGAASYEYLPECIAQHNDRVFLMDVLLSSFGILARWDVIAALLIGSVGGVIIGAIPGVGAAVAIAILLPATFIFDPIVGLTALLGIYGSSMYGGAIPAILINTPGTAVNALTTYDGYPMTKRGEGRRALALAYSASFFGGVFAILCLILLSPLLASFAQNFGSREIFLAALLGIILVIVAHRGQTLIAAAFAFFRDLVADHWAGARLFKNLHIRAKLVGVGCKLECRGAGAVRNFTGVCTADR